MGAFLMDYLCAEMTIRSGASKSKIRYVPIANDAYLKFYKTCMVQNPLDFAFWEWQDGDNAEQVGDVVETAATLLYAVSDLASLRSLLVEVLLLGQQLPEEQIQTALK